MSSGSFGQKNAQSSSVKQSPSLNAKGKEEIGKKSIWSYDEERKKEEEEEEDEKQELEFAEGFRRIKNIYFKRATTTTVQQANEHFKTHKILAREMSGNLMKMQQFFFFQ